jgi:hypothetical protein
MPRATKVKDATYRVCNPRGIPAGKHILRCGERYWFEGESFDLAEATVAARVPVDKERLLRDGLIEEVS